MDSKCKNKKKDTIGALFVIDKETGKKKIIAEITEISYHTKIKNKFKGFKKGQLVSKQEKIEPINAWIESEINSFDIKNKEAIMKFYDYFIKQLEGKGMFKNQAEKVMKNVIANNPQMKDRWKDDMSNYPDCMTTLISASVNAEALKFIKEECPEAWFRPLFDIEHPLRKEFEK